ncbi:Serine/threonine/tyrosine-interacting protein like [Argiope bruennichi]|uniref:Serine/threonine/tyrosine-interacting protein like n=2 Tax=Argiope bruennichi TaxID=94029 RepID=A0A8T0F6L6_ARGBR|nr:Serine/threonine/tyrosine-interacting protein like [Argiope bruennichi]
MRREMQEIIPGLYLGPLSSATKPKLNSLLETGITHIVCVRHEKEASFIKPNFPESFKYIVINISEPETSNLIPLFSQVKAFIDNCLKNGGKVLVHGNTGNSMSASLVIAYIMETKSMTLKDALLVVQKKRQCIGPSESFLQQLKEYEPIYKAMQTHLNGHTSKVTGKLKRRFDELEDNVTLNSKMDICEESPIS